MTGSFFFAMLVATLILFVITRRAAENIMRHHYAQKADFFRRYRVQAGDIVFLGDSITDGAQWDEIFPALPLKNRGINGDTTEGVLRRLPEIIEGQPAALFLLIGTNDLPWFAYRSDEGILNTYEQILAACREKSPATQVFVQSILPRHRSYSRRIQRLNQALQHLADRYGNTFIDLYPHFVDDKGGLRREFTNDNLHLLAAGYACWAEVLAPHIGDLRNDPCQG